jgi:hypothetical protein
MVNASAFVVGANDCLDVVVFSLATGIPRQIGQYPGQFLTLVDAEVLADVAFARTTTLAHQELQELLLIAAAVPWIKIVPK